MTVRYILGRLARGTLELFAGWVAFAILAVLVIALLMLVAELLSSGTVSTH